MKQCWAQVQLQVYHKYYIIYNDAVLVIWCTFQLNIASHYSVTIELVDHNQDVTNWHLQNGELAHDDAMFMNLSQMLT